MQHGSDCGKFSYRLERYICRVYGHICFAETHLGTLISPTESIERHSTSVWAIWQPRSAVASWEPSRDIPADDADLIDIRWHCEYLPQYVDKFIDGHQRAQDAIANLPIEVLAILDKLHDMNWRPAARRDFLDDITTWPGDNLKISNRVRALLDAAGSRPPFVAWTKYLVTLDGYRSDLWSIRDEIAGPEDSEEGSRRKNTRWALANSYLELLPDRGSSWDKDRKLAVK